MTLNETLLTHGTTSPFLPGTKIQYAIDSTTIGLVKTCARLYQYTILEGWSPKDESVHLRFGIEYHAALQAYDISRANGISHEDSIHDVVHTTLHRIADWQPDPTTKAGKYKNPKTLIGLVIDYLDYYNPDPAETYIKSDGTPAVELSFRFELDWGPREHSHKWRWEPPSELWSCASCGATMTEDQRDPDNLGCCPSQPYILCGHLDKVVNFNDGLFVLDHKTTTTTPGQYYFAQYEPNNQMSLYTLAGSVVLNTPIRGVIISAAQICLEQENKFIRGFTYRTPDQIDEWLLDLRFHLNNMESWAEAGYYPMNDTACDKFGGCKFRGVCSKSPDVREMFLRADFIQLPEEEKWNPLASR